MSIRTIARLASGPEIDSSCSCGFILGLWGGGHGDVLCYSRGSANIHGSVVWKSRRPNNQVTSVGSNPCKPFTIRSPHRQVILFRWRSTFGQRLKPLINNAVESWHAYKLVRPVKIGVSDRWHWIGRCYVYAHRAIFGRRVHQIQNALDAESKRPDIGR